VDDLFRTTPEDNTMNPVPAITRPVPGATVLLGRIAPIGILLATTVNLGLYTVGRAVDASMLMEEAYGTPAHQIRFLDVALKTLIPLVFGVATVSLVARRWRRRVDMVTVAGAAIGILSGIPAALRAHDSTTGVLIASMHTVAGVTFLIIARRSQFRARPDGRRSPIGEARQAK
jgi:hypothetical protein